MLNERLSPTSPTLPSKLDAGFMGAILSVGVIGLWYVFNPNNKAFGIVPLTAAPFVTAAPIVLLAFALLFGWKNRKNHYHAIYPIGAITLAPVLFVHARAALDVLFILDGCNYEEVNVFRYLESFFGSALAGFALVSCSTLGFLLARYLVKRLPQWLGPALHIASLGVFGSVVCLLLAVAPRAFLLPAPERYVESLPIIASVPLNAFTEPTRVETGTNWKLEIEDIPVADFVVRSICVYDKKPLRCLIELRESMEERRRELGEYDYPVRLGLKTLPPEITPACGPDTEFMVKRSSLVLREDRARGLVFVDGDTPRDARIRRAAKRSRGLLSMTYVSFRDIADLTSPPSGWIGTALVGFALACWFLLRRNRIAHRQAEFAAAHAGVLGENGWIDFVDESSSLPPFRIGKDQGLVPGPVLVFPGEPPKVPHSSPYRDAPQGDHGEIVCGERALLIARTEDDKLTWSARALALLLLTAMPLLAAIEMWFFG